MELLPKRPCRPFQKALALMRQFCSLRRDLARHQQIEPVPNRPGEIDDFGRHCRKSPNIGSSRCSILTLDPHFVGTSGFRDAAGRPIGASENGYTLLADRFQYLSVNDT